MATAGTPGAAMGAAAPDAAPEVRVAALRRAVAAVREAVGAAVVAAGATAVVGAAAAAGAAVAEGCLLALFPLPVEHADRAIMPRATPRRSDLREERLNIRSTYLERLVSGSSAAVDMET